MHAKFKNPELFSPSIAERGWHYFQNRRVGAVYDNGRQRYQAEISGSEPYQAWLQLDGKGRIVEGGCDCPCNYPCKHMAALWYALEKGRKHNVATPPDLTALLEKQDAPFLRNLLSVLAQDQEIRNRLMLMLEPDKAESEQIYAFQVQQIFAAYGGDYHYSAAINLAGELQDWLSDVSNRGGSVLAGILPLLMGRLIDAIEYSDDSEGELSDTMCYAIDLLGQVLERQDASESKLAQLVEFVDVCLNDSRYSDFGDYITDLYFIRAREWERQQAFAAWQAWLESKIAAYRPDDWLYEFFSDAKRQMLLKAKEDEAAQKYFEKNLELVSFRQIAVAQAFETENWSKAEQLLQEGIRIAFAKNNHGTVAAWEKQLLEVYRRTGQSIRMLAEKLALDKSFSPEYYRIWKETFSAEEWPSERDKLVQRLQDKDWILAPVLLEERLFDPLLDLLRRKKEYATLENYSPKFPKTYDAALLECHLSLLAASIQMPGANRKHYSILVKRLNILKKQYPHCRAQFANFVDALKAQYSIKPHRPALLEELAKFKL